MSTGRMNAVCCDAGPLIHLSEIDSIALLSIYDNLHIPDAVWAESIGRERTTLSDVSQLGNVQRRTLARRKKSHHS